VKIEKHQGSDFIEDSKKVKVINMGHLVEVMAIEKCNRNGLPITKLSKDQYVVNETGEIKDYEHTDNSLQNRDNLRKTFKKIRHLINYNFRGNKNELAFTITYKENMTDVKRLYKDFERFIKRIRYKYPDIDYLSVVEPQGRGAWHSHVLVKVNGVEKVYIPNKELADLWGNGFVTVKAIRQNVDNMGAYLSAYLGDVELNNENVQELAEAGYRKYEVKEVEIEGIKKKFIKGGRLHMYPTGMNIYRKSEGIKHPPEEWLKYAEVKKIVGSTKPNYTETLSIFDDEGEELNTISYEHYNLKRHD
jgi:hypothetical protein